MTDQFQPLFIAVIFIEAILCTLKLAAVIVNLGWFIKHGQEYRRRLDKIRNPSKQGISRSGTLEVYHILNSMGGAGKALVVGINEVGLRYRLEMEEYNPTHRSPAKRLGLRALLFMFDFPSIALVGGLSLVIAVQSLDTPNSRVPITTIGAVLVTLLISVMTVLNVEATVHHACIGRYAHSFINTGNYLRGLERNRLLREIGIVAGQVLATVFVATIAVVYLANVGIPITPGFIGVGVEGFFDGAYLSAMTFIFSTPIEPLSWYSKAFVLVTSIQGGLLLLLSLAVMIDSGEQRT